MPQGSVRVSIRGEVQYKAANHRRITKAVACWNTPLLSAFLRVKRSETRPLEAKK
jgi:hypothetical protein